MSVDTCFHFMHMLINPPPDYCKLTDLYKGKSTFFSGYPHIFPLIHILYTFRSASRDGIAGFKARTALYQELLTVFYRTAKPFQAPQSFSL